MSGDTSLGGPYKSFPRTTMGLVGDLRRPGSDLTEFCRRYWKPFFAYIRMVRAKSNEDAKDLTQEFFAWLLESDVLQRFEPAQGSLRRYLKTVLGRFVKDRDKGLTALKRGGGARPVSLDLAAVSEPKGTDPDVEFDREWAMTLAREAIERVREDWTAAGRGGRFRVYELYDLSDPRPTYEELGQRLGLKPGDVRHALEDARHAIRAEIRRALAEGGSRESDLRDEWNALFGS